ncbi:diacylglycerol kinase family protein [Bacilli bacterium]|nr:diacylglycerol kinase [Bacilli bacterium]PZD88983.1 diacylglycerol kinase [Bacilli bacterium]PZD92411.1 diacylglycerol kinase [Bacilli bacterium]RCO07323.1 diacylglycerol kinase family protein [Bacilli bacterium]RCO11188.1 diacylglycerol kinase family protein [Bacilli bacterium]
MNLVLKDKKKKIGFSHAWNGIKETVKNEYNFRIHLAATLVVVVCGFIFEISLLEWMFVFFAIGLVLVTEMINSVTEAIVDYIKPEYHPQAKYIKDAAAGAVLISVIIAVIIGTIIFIPSLYKLL